MTNSKESLIKPVRTLKRLALALLIISFFGFLDATYLAVKHYTGMPINCSILNGCDRVTASPYATIGPISVALLGAIYYLIIFVLVVLYLDTQRNRLIYSIAQLTVLGFLASLWFLYLQIFVIKAFCLYCLGSALSSTLLFIFGLIILRLKSTD